MAVRKLSLPLFSAKTHYFHFIPTISQKTDQYALVCESQSTVTRRGRVYLRPKRRPERPAQAF